MSYRQYPSKRHGFVSICNIEAQSNMLDNPSQLRKENDECKAQIASLTHTNSCLRVKISYLKKRIKTPPLTIQHSSEDCELKVQLKRLEEENKILQERNKELEKSKFEMERQQRQQHGGSWRTVEETMEQLENERKIFTKKQEDFQEEVRKFEEKKQKDMEMLQAANICLDENKKELETMWQKLTEEKAEVEEIKIQMKSENKTLQTEKRQVKEKLQILALMEEEWVELRKEKVQLYRAQLQLEKDQKEVEEMRKTLGMEETLMVPSRVKVEEKGEEEKARGQKQGGNKRQ